MFHNTDTEMYIPLGVGDYGNVVHIYVSQHRQKNQIYIGKGNYSFMVLVGQRRHTSVPSCRLLNVKKEREILLDNQILVDVILQEGRSRN